MSKECATRMDLGDKPSGIVLEMVSAKPVRVTDPESRKTRKLTSGEADVSEEQAMQVGESVKVPRNRGTIMRADIRPAVFLQDKKEVGSVSVFLRETVLQESRRIIDAHGNPWALNMNVADDLAKKEAGDDKDVQAKKKVKSEVGKLTKAEENIDLTLH